MFPDGLNASVYDRMGVKDETSTNESVAFHHFKCGALNILT